MVHIRGSPNDYDEWAAEGCTGWSYNDVLPYFMKSEDVQIPELQDKGMLR
jgi:choline dehydrogenase-like flavoprotein